MSDSTNALPRVAPLRPPTTIPDRIGIIGSMQGVKASAIPKPKKLRMMTQKLPLPSSATIADSSWASPAAPGGAGAARDCAVTNAVLPALAPGVAELPPKAASLSCTLSCCGG
jgi:hypothetical protein